MEDFCGLFRKTELNEYPLNTTTMLLTSWPEHFVSFNLEEAVCAVSHAIVLHMYIRMYVSVSYVCICRAASKGCLLMIGIYVA